MPAAGVLDERLREIIDQTPTMVLLASPASAESYYVNIEVGHFLQTHESDRLIIIVIGKTHDRLPPLPAALTGRDGERLWIDCRDTAGPSRRALVRVAAAILGVDFDLLWGRHRRRARWIMTAWVAVVLLIAAIVGGALWQENLAQQRTPQRQLVAFQEWFGRKVGVSEDDPAFTVTRSDDLNNDGWNDYIVENHVKAFCGSGGCHTEVYITKTPGHYVKALDLLGDTTPRVRGISGGRKQIVVTELTIHGEPLYTAYTPHGRTFQLTDYEFCDGTYFEYCRPTIITPLPRTKLSVRPNTVALERPTRSASPVEDLKHAQTMVKGVLPGHKWYLVSGIIDAQYNRAGFAPASAVR